MRLLTSEPATTLEVVMVATADPDGTAVTVLLPESTDTDRQPTTRPIAATAVATMAMAIMAMDGDRDITKTALTGVNSVKYVSLE